MLRRVYYEQIVNHRFTAGGSDRLFPAPGGRTPDADGLGDADHGLERHADGVPEQRRGPDGQRGRLGGVPGGGLVPRARGGVPVDRPDGAAEPAAKQRQLAEREPELLLRVPVPEHRRGPDPFDGLLLISPMLAWRPGYERPSSSFIRLADRQQSLDISFAD